MALTLTITNEQLYKTSYPLNTVITIPPINQISMLQGDFPYYGEANIAVTKPDNTVVNISSTNEGGGGGGQYTFQSEGTYILRYSGKNYWQDTNSNPHFPTSIPVNYSFYYQIAVVENKLPLKRWTITDAIKRLLDLCEPLRKGETPRFKLNAEQAEKFDKILAPEFSFTKQTLRECLQQIGGFIHGEPRLKPVKDESGKYYYEVRYDMYAGEEGSDLMYVAYTDKGQQHVIDNYLGWVDSSAENLINQLDKCSGVIIEPYAKGVQSVRTENLYVRIEEGNMLIPTQYPIYDVEKLEYVYSKDGVLKTVDITPYVFEKSDYDSRLSSYEGTYPYSKIYALCFTQGSKNIVGLNFKPPAESDAAEAFKNYAIVNILREATNDSSLFPFKPFDAQANNEYPKMCFRVTYTPFYNVRVSQTKAYYKDFKYPAALIYNQASNVIESRAYGENLKGIAARLGNVEMTLTYHLCTVYELPIAGLKFNKNYYISAVATEILPNMIKCTVALSKDFNRLSQYIGVSSVKRYSEISQNQAIERNTLYREYIVIGDKEPTDNDTLIGQGMLTLIAWLFITPVNEGEFVSIGPVTNVLAWGSTYNGTALNAVNLPVISSAFGNSMSFSWKYADNYSAGPVSVPQQNANVKGYFQNSYMYTDYYGRMYYYDFDLQLEGPQIGISNYEQIGQQLPGGTAATVSSGIVSTIGKSPYIIRKDNRESLQVNFQIDFVTNIETLIIGSALASYCPAVRGTDETLKPKLYVFPNELNKFADHVEGYEDVNLNELPGAAVDVSIKDGYIELTADNFPANGKSWAIVTTQRESTEEVEGEDGKPTQQTTYYGGDLLIGQNIDVQAGRAFTPIYFTPKREIFDKTVWKDRW